MIKKKLLATRPKIDSGDPRFAKRFHPNLYTRIIDLRYATLRTRVIIKCKLHDARL